jgi:hypothetical protein
MPHACLSQQLSECHAFTHTWIDGKKSFWEGDPILEALCFGNWKEKKPSLVWPCGRMV